MISVAVGVDDPPVAIVVGVLSVLLGTVGDVGDFTEVVAVLVVLLILLVPLVMLVLVMLVLVVLVVGAPPPATMATGVLGLTATFVEVVGVCIGSGVLTFAPGVVIGGLTATATGGFVLVIFVALVVEVEAFELPGVVATSIGEVVPPCTAPSGGRTFTVVCVLKEVLPAI